MMHAGHGMWVIDHRWAGQADKQHGNGGDRVQAAVRVVCHDDVVRGPASGWASWARLAFCVVILGQTINHTHLGKRFQGMLALLTARWCVAFAGVTHSHVRDQRGRGWTRCQAIINAS